MRRYRADQDRRIEASNFGETITRFIGDLNWQRHSCRQTRQRQVFRCRDKNLPSITWKFRFTHTGWFDSSVSTASIRSPMVKASFPPVPQLCCPKPNHRFAYRIAASHHAGSRQEIQRGNCSCFLAREHGTAGPCGLVGPIGRRTESPAFTSRPLARARGSPTILAE